MTTALLRTSYWECTLRLGGAIGVLLFLGIGGSPSFGQVPEDSAAVDTVGEAQEVQPAPPDSVQTEDVTSSGRERAVVNADSLSALVRDGERLQELFDNVFVRQDTTRLRSNFALRYLNRDELLFTGDVVIYERGDTLRADTVRYNKRTKVGRARSNVRLTDGEVVVRAPRATYYTDEKRSVFPDSVTLVDSNRVLRAQSGTYWSDDRRAEFKGDVHLTDPETHLESDSLAYFRDEERSIATGRVFIRRIGADEDAPRDTTERTYLFGDWADNQEQNRYSRVEGQALLVRVRMDSTGVPEDTLAVRARQLEAYRTDTHRRMVAVDSVRIWQTDLAAVADSAVYDRVVGTGEADSTAEPSPLPDTTSTPVLADSASRTGSRTDSLIANVELVAPGGTDAMISSPGDVSTDPAPTPDSVKTPGQGAPPAERDTTQSRPSEAQAKPGQARAEPVQAQAGPPPDSGASGASTQTQLPEPEGQWGRPTAESDDDLPLEETRLFNAPITWFERSQVWGDSIRVRAHERSLDTVYVRGAAFAAQEDTTADRIQQLKGRTITAYFRRDSVRRILARPNGQAIRFSVGENDSLSGATQASADYAELRFRGGEVETVKFGPGIQGTAYHEKEHIPDPFRLEGFQWTPERKPTKHRLLREDRVRERLDLGERPPPRRIAGTEPPGAADPRDPYRPDSTRTDGPSEVRSVPGMERTPPDSSFTGADRPPVDSLRERTSPSQRVPESDSTDTSGSDP